MDSRILLRPIANPLPLGFVGLAGATVMLSGLQLGWIPMTEKSKVGLLIMLVAVPVQLIACVMGFLARDPAAATGVGTLAVSWLAIGAATFTGAPGARSLALGVLLFYLAAAVLVSAVVASFGKLLVPLVLGITAARFAVTGVYQYVGGTVWMRAAGWIGVALAAVAVLAIAALEVRAMGNPVTDEAGVRGQL